MWRVSQECCARTISATITPSPQQQIQKQGGHLGQGQGGAGEVLHKKLYQARTSVAAHRSPALLSHDKHGQHAAEGEEPAGARC